MNISLENVDKVSAVLTVKIDKADYEGKVDAALKNYRKKASMPGFRPGQVPMGMLKKRFGKEVAAEEINKLLGESLYGYIKDNNINMLGEPLPNEERQKPVDFDTMEEFEFVFDIALAPEFKAELTADDSLAYYDIEVSDEMVEKQVKLYAQRGGSYVTVDSYQEKDMVKGLLAELDENSSVKEGGIQVEGAVMLPNYMKNDEQKAIFNDCKVNDVLIFNPFKAYDGHDVEISSLLKITKEEAAEMKADFSFQVQEITRFQEAELNQELFDQILGEGVVSSEDEFRANIKKSLEEQLVSDSDYKLMVDVRSFLNEKVGKLEFPDALLKRVMLLNNADKGEDFVEKNYDQSIEELQWHLIKEQLVKQFEIKVEQEDLMNAAKNVTKMQFAQYGMMNVPEEIMNNYAAELLKKKDQIDGLVNRSVEQKLADAIKGLVKLDHKTVGVEEFNKLFAE